MKIVILDGYSLNPGDLDFSIFEEFGEVVIYDRTPENLVMERLSDADVVLVNKIKITREIIENSRLRYIGVFATGYNGIDIEAATEKNIVVVNVPHYSSEAVAQMTFALLLEASNQVKLHTDLVKDGKWSKSSDFCFWDKQLFELKDKTIGLIGFGSIGKEVAKLATAFNMKILVCSRTVYQKYENDNLKFVDIDYLYKNSDIISLHCPLFKSTEKLIDQDAIEKMKEGVTIINTSRGGLIDEPALIEGLKNKIGYACLDVLTSEPPKKDNELFKLENVYITPHIAWAAYETRKRLLDIAFDNLKGFIDKKAINRVN